MKTPKELLLSRHRDSEPTLDAIREEVLRELASQRGKPASATAQPSGASWLMAAWQELFVSCRRYWMGLGTAWCGILLVGLLGAGETLTRGGMSDGSSPATMEAVQEQFQLRAELLTGDLEPDPRGAPAEPAPRPRSSLQSQLIVV
jgi:hypothetical protein